MVKKDPPPKYDEDKDAVMGYVVPRFGPKNWELPIVAIPMSELEATLAANEDNGMKVHDMHLRWFARLLLAGKVNIVCFVMALLLYSSHLSCLQVTFFLFVFQSD